MYDNAGVLVKRVGARNRSARPGSERGARTRLVPCLQNCRRTLIKTMKAKLAELRTYAYFPVCSSIRTALRCVGN